MPLRPARCYKDLNKPPYTRKEYIDGIPQPKINKFVMGNPHGDFDVALELVSYDYAQIRHNALEAARMAVNKLLERRLGRQGYFFKINVYPHHILREHKMMTGAGADRLSKGMKMAFGRPVGLAARVRRGQNILFVRVNKENLELAKEALRRGASKIPTPTRIMIFPVAKEA